ncbi:MULTISPECIES: anti-sigma factor domain-containing protein [unclassified Duganella]|uniref:anti-sigma factor n=1 Tax=unclassified Duganella TaxID=2636909 RepID=UPI00088675BD|nr:MULTISPECIES: anti-sigma factor [unclassified Duganella]SDG66156.1 Anti-sigma-K factor RskA [Duganella sp. OV458]SDJ91383.1 Anti-sigma-K factor RskA [Duganella sp. OV510]
MNETPDQLQQLAGEYVLGTLPAAARQEVEQRLTREPLLRAEVEGWERRLLPLTSLAAPAEPSTGLWLRIAASVQARPATAALRGATVPVPVKRWHRWWDDLRLWRGLTGGAVAASMVLALLLVSRPSAPETAYMVVLAAPQDRGAGWVVQTSMKRQLTLTPLHDTVVPERKALQFWTKAPGWSGPVSLGLVQSNRSLKLALDKLPPVQPDQLFEITLEPVTGSPTGKPTGPVLYIGKAVKVM